MIALQVRDSSGVTHTQVHEVDDPDRAIEILSETQSVCETQGSSITCASFYLLLGISQ